MDHPTDLFPCLPANDALPLPDTSSHQSTITFAVPEYPTISNHESSLPVISRPPVGTFSSCLPLPTPINHVVLLPNVKRSNNIILIQPDRSRTSARTVPSCTSTPEPSSRRPVSVSEQSSSTDATSETPEDADIVAWMKENFKADPLSLLSREHVYESYKKFATERGKVIMNPACLGKAMRKVFPGMKTRRLGKRGDSKYHYSGIDTLSKENRSATSVPLPLQRKRRTSPNSPSAIKQKATPVRPSVVEVPVLPASHMVPPRKKRKIKSTVILDKDIVKWLQRNFRSNPVSVIPRDFVFNKYREYCEKINKTDTNAACFGKTLRGVFPHMETRRLGSRGSSKYHYAGIEVHPNGDYEEGPPFFKMARRQKFRSTSVSSADTPSIASSLPTESTPDHVSITEPSPQRSTEPTEDQVHALNVVEVLQKFIDMIPDTACTSYICPTLRKKSAWTEALASCKSSKNVGSNDFDSFFCHLRVHIGMLAHCFLSGAFLGLPEILGNFWVTRKKSLQVPERGSRKVFDAIITEPSVQNIVRDAYLHSYDALVWRLMSGPASIMPCSLAYVLIDFLHKFPFWVRHTTRTMPSSEMRAIVCHTAAAFSVQLEKLTRMSELEEKLRTADTRKEAEFAQDSVFVLSHILAETASKFSSSTCQNLDRELSQARTYIGFVSGLLDSSSDLTRFLSQLQSCENMTNARLEKEFIGGRLLKEKLEALTSLQTTWTNIIDQFDTDKSYSKYLTSLWKTVLTLFTEKEKAALEKVLPILGAFTPIAEKLGAQIPEVLSSDDLEVSLPYFVQNNVKDLRFLTRPDNLTFYLKSPELQLCLDSNGDVVEADLDR